MAWLVHVLCSPCYEGISGLPKGVLFIIARNCIIDCKFASSLSFKFEESKFRPSSKVGKFLVSPLRRSGKGLPSSTTASLVLQARMLLLFTGQGLLLRKFFLWLSSYSTKPPSTSKSPFGVEHVPHLCKQYRFMQRSFELSSLLRFSSHGRPILSGIMTLIPKAMLNGISLVRVHYIIQ